jgi:hypothetical protein
LVIKLQVGGLLQPGIYVVLGHGDLLGLTWLCRIC